ncbi:beta-N-acetylhexosaminidase [Paenibacillus methanolicus]|uniref:beta-N-acetylhexosaminidase n=1 Tax=Paenibacillus methanolicus TaxID=582686 RepID=A0A5S5CAD3_9BACL|nr:beta-N-acetylhexosaminidase [Paenibacillus methanolicus]TYP75588.1 beta-N-acetylhexosaminidase [Paenibacillus methanolicus]
MRDRMRRTATAAAALLLAATAAGCAGGQRQAVETSGVASTNDAANATSGAAGDNGQVAANPGTKADGQPQTGTAGEAHEEAPNPSTVGGGAVASTPGASSGAAEADAAGSAADAALLRQIAGMTLEERIGQLIVAGVDGTAADAGAKRMIRDQHVGGVIFYKDNLASAESVIRYVNQLKAWNAGGAAPLLLSVDQEGGKVSRLPELKKLPNARVIGDTGDAGLAEDVGEILARACLQLGLNVDFAPVLDINSNPANPVIGGRAFGSGEKIVTEMGLATMKGIRSQGVIPVVKHFPGHGDTAVDSHLDLPVVNKGLDELKAFEWKPFEAAIQEGAGAVMVAHILFPKIDPDYPASLSKTIVTDQLRGMLGFQGVVITDDLTMGAIADHYGIGEAAALSVKAGADLVLIAHKYGNVDKAIAAIAASVKRGELTEARLNESVLRVLRMKANGKLSDEAIGSPRLAPVNEAIAEVLAQAARP